jgi:DNA-binding CsgD family transcriptional regulator
VFWTGRVYHYFMGGYFVRGWPLVGRDEELGLAAQAIDRQEAPGVVFAGSAGVGKTRLAREVVEFAIAQRVHAEFFVATQAGSRMPFGAFGELASESPAAPKVVNAGGMVQAIVKRAKGSRLLVVVDDAHLLDEASAVVVHQLAARGVAAVVLTVLTSQPAPGPVISLWKDQMLDRVELQPLSRGEVDRLLEAALGHPVDRVTLQRIWRISGGNALFLRELVAGAIDDGLLMCQDQMWHWRGRFPQVPRLVDLVADRFGRLRPAESRLFELLAWGEPLGARLVEDLAPGVNLIDLERRGLIAVERDGRRRHVQLAHPLYAGVVRAAIPELRVDEICRTLAAAITAKGRRRPQDSLVVAQWRLHAHDQSSDAAVFVDAARRTPAIVDPPMVERLARAALAVQPRLPDACVLLGEALSWQGRTREAAQVLSVPESGDDTDEQVTRLALARAVRSCWGDGLPGTAERLLRSAERQVAGEGERQELEAFRAGVSLAAGQCRAALEVACRIVYNPSCPANLVRALLAAVPALALTGHVERAISEGRRGIEALAGLPEAPPESASRLPLAVAHALRLDGRLEEAQALAWQVHEDTLRRGVTAMTGAALTSLGMIALDAGRATEAIRLLREGTILLTERDIVGYRALAMSSLARAYAIAAIHANSRWDRGAAAAAAQDAAERALGPADSAYAPEVRLGRCWVAVATGRFDDAAALAIDAAEVATTAGQDMVTLIALHEAIRLGARQQTLVRLVSHAEQIDGRLVTAFVKHANALASDDGHQLEEASHAFADLGARLLAAEAAAEAAAAYSRRGLQTRTAAARTAAAALQTSCEGAITPALELLGPAVVLTARECQIAALAAAGLTNRQIGSRLGLSVRTVESHLAHGYNKLGISQRHDLARHLPQSPGAQHRLDVPIELDAAIGKDPAAGISTPEINRRNPVRM